VPEQCPGNHGLTRHSSGCKLAVKLSLQLLVLEQHFAGQDLGLARAGVAQLTYSDTAFIPHRRPKHPTGERSRAVQLAAASRRIKHRAGAVRLG